MTEYTKKLLFTSAIAILLIAVLGIIGAANIKTIAILAVLQVAFPHVLEKSLSAVSFLSDGMSVAFAVVTCIMFVALVINTLGLGLGMGIVTVVVEFILIFATIFAFE